MFWERDHNEAELARERAEYAANHTVTDRVSDEEQAEIMASAARVEARRQELRTPMPMLRKPCFFDQDATPDLPMCGECVDCRELYQ